MEIDENIFPIFIFLIIKCILIQKCILFKTRSSKITICNKHVHIILFYGNVEDIKNSIDKLWKNVIIKDVN